MTEVYATHCPNGACDIKFTSTTARLESWLPTVTSIWAGRFFLAAVLLVGLHVKRMKVSRISRVCPPHGSNSTVKMFFTLTLSCFSPSMTTHQSSEWSWISCVACLSCTQGRTVHVLITCRAARTVVKLFCATQRFRPLSFAVLLLCLIVGPPFANKSVTDWFGTILLHVLGCVRTDRATVCLCIYLTSWFAAVHLD